jgi:hypothetical protein
VKPPTTRTHCGAGVLATWALSMSMASASERTPSQRSSMLKFRPPRMTCVWLSIRPGSTLRCCRSILRAAARQGQHFGIRAHRGELAILDGHGLGNGLALVQRGDPPAVKDDVGGLWAWRVLAKNGSERQPSIPPAARPAAEVMTVRRVGMKGNGSGIWVGVVRPWPSVGFTGQLPQDMVIGLACGACRTERRARQQLLAYGHDLLAQQNPQQTDQGHQGGAGERTWSRL